MKPAIFVSALESLAPREREVLELIAKEGLKNEAIAKRLGIAMSTVETHRARGLRAIAQYSREDVDLRLFTSLWWTHANGK